MRFSFKRFENLVDSLEKEIDITNYNLQERRVLAYIAERLLGIFYLHLKKNNNLKYTELAKINYKNLLKTNFKYTVYILIRKMRPLYFD